MKRIISVLLSLLLCLSLFPAGAFAEDTWFVLDDGITESADLSENPFFESETVNLQDYFEDDPLMNGDPFAGEASFEFFMEEFPEETAEGPVEDALFFLEDLTEDDSAELEREDSSKADNDNFVFEELLEDEDILPEEQTAIVFYNKMFFDNEDIAAERPDILRDLLYTRSETPFLAAANAGTIYSDVNAAAQLRNAMVNRKANISITVNNSTGENVENLCKNIVYMATRHTGNPKEGDYITWQGLAVIVDQPTASESSVTLNFSMRYVTTAAQEAQVDTAVSNLRSQLGLSGKTDYQKIKAVYDWLTVNITYDMSTDLTHTAYAAIINKRCCCQGYSQLFYRMMLEEGIDARVVRGTGSGGGHAWNIVRMEGSYYYIDATWDAHMPSEYYSYFLDGADHFTVEHFAWQPSFMGDSLNYDPNFLSGSYYDFWYTTLSTGADITDYAISAAPYSRIGLTASLGNVYITESDGATVDLVSSSAVTGVNWGHVYGEDIANVSIKEVSDFEYQVAFSAKKGAKGSGQYSFSVYDKNGKTSNECCITITASSDYYTLKYEFEGGTGEIESQTTSYESGTYYVLITNKIPTKTHYRFLWWLDKNNQIITPGTTYVLSGDETLRAKWETTAIQLTFDANGGTVSSASKTAYYDDVYGTLPTPSKSGFIFSGWYTARSGGEKITSETEIVRPENHTLYAHWYDQSLFTPENFPDSNFLAALLELKPDPSITASLDVSNRGISDLTGIELFTELETLDCSFNNLTTLDMSGNPALTELLCDNNKLTKLDVQENSALTELYCGYNHLAALDLTVNTNLCSGELVPQDIVLNGISESGETVIDLTQVIPADLLSRVTLVSDGEYDASTGLIKVSPYTEGITYSFDTGNENARSYEVTVSLENVEEFLTSENFPDEKFLEALQNQGATPGTTYLDVSYCDISSLTGIELFTKLETLDCI